MPRLAETLVFDIAWGRCITSQGFIPIFLRPTNAGTGYFLNGSWKSVLAGKDQPRFLVDGSLVLEAGATNHLPHSQNLSDPSWIKGSRIQVFKDIVLGVSENYRADQISVAAFNGNDNAQRLTRTLTLGSGRDMTLTVYLALVDGTLGGEDIIRVSGAVVAPASVSISYLNDRIGNYVPVSLNFRTLGTEPVSATAEDTARTIEIELFVKKAVTLNWGGAQLEDGLNRTNLIEQDSLVTTRAPDFLQYPRSPVAALSSFVFYLHLIEWRGDGRIVEAGNFKVNIVGGKLEVNCGGTIVTDPDLLPADAKIAVWVSRGFQQIRIYINTILKAIAPISSYLPTQSPVTVCGEGYRRFNPLYFLRGDIQDGGKVIGQAAGGDMGLLHANDAFVVEQSEGRASISMSTILIPTGRKATVKFPGNRVAAQAITAHTGSGSDVAKLVRVTVQTITNPNASQTDWIMVNSTRYTLESNDTPTAAAIAAAFADAVNRSPKYERINASYNASNTFFDLTAAIPGSDFLCSASERLNAVIITHNTTAKRVFTVASAGDFVLGPARVERDYAHIMDVFIESINPGTSQLTVTIPDSAEVQVIHPGDLLVQEDWTLRCGTSNYVASHDEDHPDVKIPPGGKLIDSVVYSNEGQTDRLVTARVGFVF